MLCTCISLNSVRAEPSSPSHLQFQIQDAAPSTGWTCSENPNRHPQSRKNLELQEHWASRFHRASWVSPALALNPGLPASRYGPPLPRLGGGDFGSAAIWWHARPFLWDLSGVYLDALLPLFIRICFFIVSSLLPDPLSGVFTCSSQKDHLLAALSSVQCTSLLQ